MIEQMAQALRFDRGLNARQLSEELDQQFPGEGVSERTVRNWIKRWGIDASGSWSLATGDPVAAGAVIRLLPDLVELHGPRALNLTVAEAEMLGRLTILVPGMPPIGMYKWTTLYLLALRAELPTRDLLAYLVFAPWTDKGARYIKALDAGHLTTLLNICPSDDEWLPAERRERVDFSMGAAIVAAAKSARDAQPDARGRD